MSDLDIINQKNIKLIDYYLSLNHLITIYLNNLLQNIENKDLKFKINTNLDNLDNNNNVLKKIKKSINTIDNKNNTSVILFLLNRYNDIINININTYEILIFIKKINIFDEKTLISDTSKNNINNNKIVILDSYNKIEIKTKNQLNSIIQYYKDNIILNDNNYSILHDFYLKNTQIIKLYVDIVKHYNNVNNISNNNVLKRLIMFNNNINKNNLIVQNLKTNNSKIKYSLNSLNQFSYLFYKNKNGVITKNNSIVNKFNYYVSNNKNKNLSKLLSNNLSININIKHLTDSINNKTLSTIHSILHDLYKVDMEFINITLFETYIDNINYNIDTLLDTEYILNKDIGINNNYINKTKTIITNQEYTNLQINDNKYKNEYYLGKCNTIYNINNFNYGLKKNNNLIGGATNDIDKILFKSSYIFINKVYLNDKEYEFHILNHVNNNNVYMNFDHVRLFLQNSPDYYIENYNIYRNKILIQYINTNTGNDNILNNYNNKIANDYKNIKKIDNLELKNNIINKIKKEKFKLTDKLKNDNIDKIIQIIINELLHYIKNQNNIEFTPELILTYYSNINSMKLKVKKELNDNYNNELINNIDNILNNIYSNIITINYNILDKYYLTQL